jgi:hypothetical protein
MAPSRAKSSAPTRPSPDDPPVINATFPVKRPMMLLVLGLARYFPGDRQD